MWITGACYYLTSSDISFVCLSVYLSLSISGFLQHCFGWGRECGYGIFVCFCYISAGSFLKALYVSCHVQPVLVSRWALPL